MQDIYTRRKKDDYSKNSYLQNMAHNNAVPYAPDHIYYAFTKFHLPPYTFPPHIHVGKGI